MKMRKDLVSGSYPYTKDSYPVIMMFIKSGSLFVKSSISSETGDESWVYENDPETVIFLTMKILREH